MNYVYLRPQSWKFHDLYRQFFLASPFPLRLACKLLFLIPIRQQFNKAPKQPNPRRYWLTEGALISIHHIFRKSLNKPCKSLKKELSCLPYVAKRCTCQYHGIRYSVCPEMEFGNKYLIFGIMNVKQSKSRKCRNAC